MTHSSPKRNMVPKAVLMRSGLVSLTTARPVNTAQPRTTVNSARPMTNVFNKAHSMVRRLINNKTTTKNSNFNQMVNTVKGKNVNTAKPKAVVNTAKPKVVVNVVRPKAVLKCCKGNPGLKAGNPHQDLEEKGVIDSGCSRHMTYLTDFEEIDGGYVSFRADSKLPTTFWAEAVNTACYVQNRVLVTKPHNKTPYELFLGRKPALGFIKPFECPVIILNTIDHLGKFDGKADEGFFVGYLINRSGPNWLFDIDALTKSMNYKRVVVGNQSNGNAGTKVCDDAGKARMETVPSKDYILLPLWTADLPFSQSTKISLDVGFKPSGDDKKKVTKEPGKEGGDPRNDSEGVDQEKEDNVNITNNINAASTNEVNVVDDDEDVGAEADMNNLDAFMPVSPIPTKRVHKDHPVEQIIRDLNSAPQTRRMTKNLKDHGLFSSVQQRINHKDFQNCLFACFLSQEEPKKVIHALKDPSWIEAMQEELLQFKLQEVWTLVDLPNRKRAIGTKWVFRNKKDERGIVIKNKARLMDVKSAFLYGKIEEEVYVCQPPGFEDPDFPDRVYKVEKALYGLHQAPKAWYEILLTYLLDNGFQRGKIDKTLFIRRNKGDILLVQVYVDDIIFGSTKKSLCTEFEKMMHKKFRMSSMGKLTFFLGLQTARTRLETQKPLLKDEDGEEVDVHMYRSMIGSLMYLTSSRPDIMFAVCACARYQVNPKVSHLHVVKRIFRYLKGQPKLGLWYPKDSPFDLVAYTDSDYAGTSLDRKSTTREAEYVAALSCCGQVLWIQNQLLDYGDSNEKKLIQMIKIHTDKNVANLLTKAFDVKGRKSFSGRVTPLFPTMMVQAQEEMDEGSANPTDPHHTPIVTQPSTSQPKKKHKPRKPKKKDTQPGDPTTNVADEAVTKENVSKHSNDPLLSDDNITLVSTHNVNEEMMFDVSDLAVEEVFVIEQGVPNSKKDDVVSTAAAQVSIAATTTTITPEDITLAQALHELKTSKPKVKGIIFKEPVETTTTTTTISSQQPSQATVQDKGKGKMVEPEPVKKFSKKDQIRLDEELAFKLQAEEEEEERLAREKVKANVALIEEWNDIQAKIEADQLLAERLQAREQEELTIKERAKLFQQPLEKRRKFFTAKRVEEKRNKPLTKA
ncbi:putative ribonuclease H-like domain-containing protein [Tanacetum coccineum]